MSRITNDTQDKENDTQGEEWEAISVPGLPKGFTIQRDRRNGNFRLLDPTGSVVGKFVSADSALLAAFDRAESESSDLEPEDPSDSFGLG
ncbi:hypothetical protein [Microvirga terricola]|uniref:Uncharacterized protein n=1 Tax=Microvirga terricola TaxID=2719797 RepID=A0ABX0VD41_9HYPH|nr:hypothetical protein [Microvirga terricola]NIX77366.1 hypothetical protein [Microvirga terricola]